MRSRFFTMDLARRRDGEWVIIELGDGQVAGLPSGSDAEGIYEALARAWPDASNPRIAPSPISPRGHRRQPLRAESRFSRKIVRSIGLSQ
jgi:hypothetical protein